MFKAPRQDFARPVRAVETMTASGMGNLEERVKLDRKVVPDRERTRAQALARMEEELERELEAVLRAEGEAEGEGQVEEDSTGIERERLVDPGRHVAGGRAYAQFQERADIRDEKQQAQFRAQEEEVRPDVARGHALVATRCR